MEEGLIYNAIFSDGHFEREKLGALINKGGAAGKIYESVTHPELVAKIFHDRAKSKTNRLKLEAMLQNKPNIEPVWENGKKFIQIAWPEAVLEDDEGFCVGYLMPLINTNEAVCLDHLMQKAVRQKTGLPENYKYRLNAAYNITAMVAALHQCGHYIIDLKPANVSVYKENMRVAMFDCDGFSIKGDRARYPAEFVSEEYIYPEGMSQTPEEMGEEQDKFALAVILFKLLNNGIHPFSGTPHKSGGDMDDIQTRIEKYHYAYGLWPDTYQDPHPYSIHEYLDSKTLELFDRAFFKNKQRPTAKEWYAHLTYLFKVYKECKKNPNHGYFTAKGCGMCAMEERFKANITAIKQEKEAPQKIRGMELSELTSEKNLASKLQKRREFVRLNKLALFVVVLWLFFFGALCLLLYPYRDVLSSKGCFLQIFVCAIFLKLLYVGLDGGKKILPLLQYDLLVNMLKIYALINIIVCFFVINGFDLSLFRL